MCVRVRTHAWVAGELIRGIRLERRKGRGGQTELAVFETLNSRILSFGNGEPVVILEPVVNELICLQTSSLMKPELGRTKTKKQKTKKTKTELADAGPL